jgi:hypothetical protein
MRIRFRLGGPSHILFKKKRRLAANEARVVREASAIVDGLPLSKETGAGRGSTWIGRLAHIHWEDLQDVATTNPYSLSTWDAAASYLARDLLHTAKNADRLCLLQRRCLIPLELEILAGRLRAPGTPADLVKAVDLDRRYHR